MITLNNIDFRYGDGDFCLQIPRLSIEPGTTTAVIGPSGSGKTTFLNLVSGISVAAQGAVTVGDVEVSALSDAARRSFRITKIGFVFQDFELIEYLNVLDNILHPYRINRSLNLTNDVRDRARQLARDVGLGDKLRRYPDKLSQGERQRAAICRALLTRPQLLLADEPTGNLDPSNKEHILSLLFDYVRRDGANMVMVTHDHSLLEGFDRVINFQDFHSASSQTAAVPPPS